MLFGTLEFIIILCATTYLYIAKTRKETKKNFFDRVSNFSCVHIKSSICG